MGKLCDVSVCKTWAQSQSKIWPLWAVCFAEAVFLGFLRIFLGSVPLWYSFSRVLRRRLSNVFVFTIPTWNFKDYTSTFPGGYDIFFLKIGLCLV